MFHPLWFNTAQSPETSPLSVSLWMFILIDSCTDWLIFFGSVVQSFHVHFFSLKTFSSSSSLTPAHGPQTGWFSLVHLFKVSIIHVHCAEATDWLFFFENSQLFIFIDSSAWSTDRLVFYGVKVLGAFKCLLTLRADKAFYMPLLVKGSQCPVCDRLPATSTLWKNRVCVAMVTVWFSLPFPVAHWCSELGVAAKADKTLRVPGLVHCTNAIRRDEVLAFCTARDKLLLVALIAIEPVLLCVDRDILQTPLAAAADKVMLVVV